MKATNYLYQIVDQEDKLVDVVESIAETREAARLLKRVAEAETGEKYRILKYEAKEYVR